MVACHSIRMSATNDREATRVDENGWPSAVFDNSGTRPFTLFNFQRSVKHYRRHLTMRTAGFRTAPRILFTRQTSMAVIWQPRIMKMGYRRHLTMITAGFRIAPRILFTRQRPERNLLFRFHHTPRGWPCESQPIDKLLKTGYLINFLSA